MIGKDEKKKGETVATFHNVSQWLQEYYGVSHPTSSTGHTSELADTLGTNGSLPQGCVSALCNIFQGVCPGISNSISTNILYCSLISLPLRFMLTQYTTSPKTSTSPFQAHSGRNMDLAKKQVECLIY